MSRRETRKIRSERRARIGTECLESRNLLSGLGSIASAQLVSVPPSSSYQTSVQGVIGPIAQLKYTGPRESVAHSKQDSPQTALWSGTGPIAQLKYTFEAPAAPSVSFRTSLQGANQNGGGAQDITKISGSFQTSLWSGTGSDTYMKITGPREAVAYFKQDGPETSVWSGSGPVAQMKITGPNESVAYSKQDNTQTAVWGASGPVAHMKITGPEVSPQTSQSAATDSFNFG